MSWLSSGLRKIGKVSNKLGPLGPMAPFGAIGALKSGVPGLAGAVSPLAGALGGASARLKNPAAASPLAGVSPVQPPQSRGMGGIIQQILMKKKAPPGLSPVASPAAPVARPMGMME